ncbi:hypothetical protein CMV_001557 [Castanea mollissima]|uniref:Uncharacterized protein n=1 Tax=Castanea mollissima TaxID=60419 RepID=A0A8J4RKM3_9ROSI|nr:hypothetical protein CMV_001557 [Castanea mollissima]
MATLLPSSFTKNFNSSIDYPITSFQTFAIFGPKLKTEQTHFRLSTSFKGNWRVVDFEITTTVQTSLFTLTDKKYFSILIKKQQLYNSLN